MICFASFSYYCISYDHLLDPSKNLNYKMQITVNKIFNFSYFIDIFSTDCYIMGYFKHGWNPPFSRGGMEILSITSKNRRNKFNWGLPCMTHFLKPIFFHAFFMRFQITYKAKDTMS